MPLTVEIAGHPIVVDDTKRDYWERLARGEVEPATVALFTTLLGPGRFLVDIGAWIGPMSLLGAATGARVVSFEPDPVASVAFERHLALNPDLAERIELRTIALGVTDGEAEMASPRGGLGKSTTSFLHVGTGEATATVTVRDIASVVPEINQADLVKIDIEGYEFVLVKRLAPLLDGTAVLCLSIHGIEWRRTSRPRVVQRASSAKARLLLLWRLRAYRHRYVPHGSGWRRVGFREAVRLLGSLGEIEVALASRPIDRTASTS
jgi:FkbM family methyltransferase